MGQSVIKLYQHSPQLTSSQDCEDVREIYGLMKEFSDSAAPGAFVADLIPPLAKIPVWMQWWRKRALGYQERQTRIWMKYWTILRRQIDEEKAPDCFVKQFIETDYEKQGISEVQAAYVAGSESPFFGMMRRADV